MAIRNEGGRHNIGQSSMELLVMIFRVQYPARTESMDLSARFLPRRKA
jgi:hypothetical protein